MEENTIYYISEAAKKVQVEAHVLRYWEDELQLAIKRNEMGHRCYTGEDIERLQQIKQLKEQGLQLKAIRTVLSGGGRILSGKGTAADQFVSDVDKIQTESSERVEGPLIVQGKEQQTSDESGMGEESESQGLSAGGIEQKVEDMVMKKAQKYMVTLSKGKEPIIETPRENLAEYNVQENMDKSQKAARLQYLLQHMVTEAVKSANQEMCTEIKESILKELDYQFRQQEERDEEHWKKEEEHYRRIDEMIRQRHLPKEKSLGEKLSGEKFSGERFSRNKRKSPINL